MWELKFRAEKYKFSSFQMNKQESYLHLCKLNTLCQLLYIVTLNEFSEYNVLVFKTEIHEANSSEPLWNFLLLHFKIDKVDVIETGVTELSEQSVGSISQTSVNFWYTVCCECYRGIQNRC